MIQFLNWPQMLTQVATIMLSAAVMKYFRISFNDYDLSYLQCCVTGYLMYLICVCQQALVELYFKLYYKYFVPNRRVMPIVAPPDSPEQAAKRNEELNEELKRAAESYKP